MKGSRWTKKQNSTVSLNMECCF